MAVMMKRIILGAFVVGALSFALIGCTLFGFLDSIQVQVGGKTTTSYDFGNQILGVASSSVTVTIANTGLFPLTFGGNSAITLGGNATADFSVSGTTSETISAGGSTSFTVTFTPSTVGTRSASLTITPSGGGGSATFAVSGSGGSSGTLAVSYVNSNSQQTVDLNSGDTTLDTMYSNGQTPVTFTISNNGTSTLYLTATPLLSVTSDPYLTLTSQPAQSVAPGDSTTFTLTFDTTNLSYGDSRSVTVAIKSSDGGNANFTFTYTVTYAQPT